MSRRLVTDWPPTGFADALGPPRGPSGPQQISGKCELGMTDITSSGWRRLISLTFPQPVSGIIIATRALTSGAAPGNVPWRTKLRMGSALGGPTLEEVWTADRVALSWAGENVTLDVRPDNSVGGGYTICAVAGLNGAIADITTGEGVAPDTLGPVVRIQDNNDPLLLAEVQASTGGNGLVAIVADVQAGVVSSLRTGTEMLREGDNGHLLTTYADRASRVRGVVNQNAFGVGGTATLIAAPGANLANVLTSVQLGSPSVTTVVTLESPSGTVLWAANLVAAVTPPPIVMPVPLAGATNGAWVVRSSAASTFSANAQGYTERVA